MITTFKNLDYSNGTDLVVCHNCDTLMSLPLNYAVCPVCGESRYLVDIDSDCQLDIDGWEEPMIEDVAKFCESGKVDKDGYPVSQLLKKID